MFVTNKCNYVSANQLISNLVRYEDWISACLFMKYLCERHNEWISITITTNMTVTMTMTMPITMTEYDCDFESVTLTVTLTVTLNLWLVNYVCDCECSHGCDSWLSLWHFWFFWLWTFPCIKNSTVKNIGFYHHYVQFPGHRTNLSLMYICNFVWHLHLSFPIK